MKLRNGWGTWLTPRAFEYSGSQRPDLRLGGPGCVVLAFKRVCRDWTQDRMASMNRHASRLLLVLGILLPAIPATSAFAQSAEEQAVLAPIHAMFDGMSKRDAAAIKAPTLQGGTMVLMRDGKPTQMTFDAFADRVGKPGKSQIEERIHDPLIRIDNDLAVVWAPFDFLVDGKVNHCGTDLFTLVHVEGEWLIASVADTGTDSCPAK